MKKHVKAKVLGLVWRDGTLLACGIEDARTRVKGARPPGGSIEFGETREDALKREFMEEFGASIAITGPWQAFENIFEHAGEPGHEIVFTANVAFTDTRFYDRDTLAGVEDDGSPFTAQWFALELFQSGTLALYPNGLKDFLSVERRAP